MDPRLQQAIENDDVDELHRLIVEDRKLLDHVSDNPFPNTPLHIAAAAGKTQVAMEVAILKPSFIRKLDPEGYSPMHLALQHEHFYTVRALMTLDPELIRVRGRCGITPFHYVAEKEGEEELDLLAEFLCACRSSIEDLTSRSETAVHIAVKNHNLKAFKVLFGWLKQVHMTDILNWKDQAGNTALHIATSEKQSEIIKLLIGHTNVNAKNFKKKTALQIFEMNPCDDQDVAKKLRHQGRKARRFTPILSLSEAFSEGKYIPVSSFRLKDASNIIIVVSTFIATATYQSILSPPGGNLQDSSSNPPANSTVIVANSTDISVGKPHQAGNLILNGFILNYFAWMNTVTFLLSIGIIRAMAIPLLPGSKWLIISLAYLAITYIISLALGFSKSMNASILLLLLLYLSLLLAMVWRSVYIWQNRIRDLKNVDDPRSLVRSLR